MLLENSEIILHLNELRKDFEAIDLNALYPAYIERFNSVEEWKFSSGDYFNHEPFFEERRGYKSASLVKKKYKSVDEARWQSKYCSGFIGGKHVVTVMPGQRAVRAVSASLYDDTELFSRIRSFTFKGIGVLETIQTRVNGFGRIISKEDNTKIYVGVGIGGAFSVSLFEYLSDGRPIRARSATKGYPGEARWEYIYTPDGELDEITTGTPLPLWKRKNKSE